MGRKPYVDPDKKVKNTIYDPEKRKEENRRYQAIPDNLLRFIYNSMVGSSRQRGHHAPSFTSDEFVARYREDASYLAFHAKWVATGQEKKNKPSFDRIDNSQGYSFENIRVTTHEENNSLGRDYRRRPVLVYKDGEFVERFERVNDIIKIGLHPRTHGRSFIDSGRSTRDGYQVFYEKSK